MHPVFIDHIQEFFKWVYEYSWQNETIRMITEISHDHFHRHFASPFYKCIPIFPPFLVSILFTNDNRLLEIGTR